jgi:hypothetical protein
MVDPKHDRDHRTHVLLVVDDENARHGNNSRRSIKSYVSTLEPGTVAGHYDTAQ